MEDSQVPDSEELLVPRRNRLVLIVVGGLALLMLLAVGAYVGSRGREESPAAAVANIASDAMSGDAASVAASLDTSSLADSAVDEVFSATDRPQVVADYLAKHPGATREQVKAKVRKTLDEEIREHVESGTLPKRIPLGSDSLKALVAGALAGRSVRSVRVEGKFAHVVVTVPYKGKRLKVAVRMRRSGDSWKVDRIENLAAVLKQAGY